MSSIDYPPITWYPYEEGDITVIGPECFCGHDDRGNLVINYKGENYDRQRPRLRARLHNLIMRLKNRGPLRG